jgi:gag-polyprotein putative aspartyl protease
MKLLCLLLLAAQSLAAAADDFALERKGQFVILKHVYLNHQGPFRMMLDTGDASSIVQPAVARRLGLTPLYAVEQVTPAGPRLVPATVLDEVQTGSVSQKAVEVVIAGGLPPGLDGVLGQSWLIHHDYLLDYRKRRLVLDADPPTGIKIPLRSVEDRPAVAATVDGHATELVLDSGANMLVLFSPSAIPGSALMSTHSGSTPVGLGSARVTPGSGPTRVMTAARVNAPRRAGLLPLCAFSTVYVSNREGFVILVR